MLTDVLEIGSETYEDMVRITIANGTNMIALGMPGIGKTVIPMDICASLGEELRYFNLSVLEAPDYIGLPFIADDRCVDYASPRFMPTVDNSNGSKPVVVLLDEIDKAKDELQNPLLELLQFRTVNGRKLNIKAVIATGNLPDDHSFSRPLSHALTNRCMVYKIRHDFDTWQKWAVAHRINSLIVGFLFRNMDMLSSKPIEGDITAYCRPSPRAWSMAGQVLDTTANASINTQQNLIAGYVGNTAAVKFAVWLEHYRHIAPAVDALMKNGEQPNTENMAPDRALVFAIMACNELRKAIDVNKTAAEVKKNTAAVTKMAVHLFTWLSAIPTDYAIAAVRSTLAVQSLFQYGLHKEAVVSSVYQTIRVSLDQT